MASMGYGSSTPSSIVSRPTGGEEAADVDVLRPNKSRPRFIDGVGEGQSLELTQLGAATEAQRDP